MAQQVFKIARVTDEQIATYLTKLAETYGEIQLNVNIVGHGLGGVFFPDRGNEMWKNVLALKSELIDHFNGSICGVTVHYYRGGHGGQVWDKSPMLDDIGIDLQGLDPQRMSVAARILELFRPIPLPSPMGTNAHLEEQRALQESVLSRLQLQTENVFAQTIDYRRQIDESVKAKETALEASMQKRMEAFESQLEEQRTALRAEKEQLDARSKALDDSDNKHARRQIRDRMLSDVSDRIENFGSSAESVGSYGAVY